MNNILETNSQQQQQQKKKTTQWKGNHFETLIKAQH